jgi:methyl-accepting chemotaxis protein
LEERETAVDREGERLRNEISDPEAHQLVDQFVSAHQALDEDYKNALQVFKDNNFDSSAADREVLGKDRLPTELLTKANARLELIAQSETKAAVAKAYRAVWEAVLVLMGLIAVALGALTVAIRRSVVRPLASMAGTINGLSSGDLSVAIEEGRRSDEIGDIARALVVLRDSLTRRRPGRSGKTTSGTNAK